MTEPNRAQRRAAAKATESDPNEVDVVDVTIDGVTTRCETGHKEIAYLELHGHTLKELEDKPVLGQYLMTWAHMLRLQRQGTVTGVSEVFDTFMDDATLKIIKQGGSPKASGQEPGTEASSS